MTGSEQERHVRPPTDAHIHALSAAAQRDLEQRVRREEQERHVERIAREAYAAEWKQYRPVEEGGRGDDPTEQAALWPFTCRAVRLALADQARRDHEHAHAILDELRNDETGGGYDDEHFRTVWNAALAAAKERLPAGPSG